VMLLRWAGLRLLEIPPVELGTAASSTGGVQLRF